MDRDELDSRTSEAENLEKIEEDVEALNAQLRITDITATFSGAIFRKAEFENNFDKVYSRVVEKMVQFEFISPEDETILEIFGTVGG